MAATPDMKEFFAAHRVPDIVITWLKDLCMIEPIADFVGYFGPRASHEHTLEDVVRVKFPVRAASDTAPGLLVERF